MLKSRWPHRRSTAGMLTGVAALALPALSTALVGAFAVATPMPAVARQVRRCPACLAKVVAGAELCRACGGPVRQGTGPNSLAFRRSAGYKRAESLFKSGLARRARPLLEPLAADGDARAQYMLSTLTARSRDDARRLLELCRMSAAQGDPCAVATMAEPSLEGPLPTAAQTATRKRAIARLRVAAGAGDYMAQLDLGVHLAVAGRARAELRDGLRWVLRSAEAGYAMAWYQLGDLYHYGFGPGVDWAAALRCYRRAGTMGLVNAQIDLGKRYLEADLVEANPAEGARWYRMAADQGEPVGQAGLALCYVRGAGVPKDGSLALEWYRKAADQGDAGAMAGIGYCYSEGLGVPKDDAQGVVWFRRAAEKGDAHGEFALGVSYYQGTGVAQDRAEAVRWFLKVAPKGDTRAMRILGNCYETGNGVQRDTAEALKWYRQAVEAGNDRAKEDLKRLEGRAKEPANP